MLDAVALANALATVPFVSLGGPWHRAIDQAYLTKPPPGFPPGSPPQPLWPGGAKEKGGRFTPKGSFDTLYLCSDPTTAMLEVGAVFRPPKGPLISARRDPLTLTQAEGTLEAVLAQGYEVEFFAANGGTVAVASVPTDAVRPATERDLLSVRVLTPT